MIGPTMTYQMNPVMLAEINALAERAAADLQDELDAAWTLLTR